MIGYVMVGTNDLNKSITYYDTLLDLLDLIRVDTSDDYAAYAEKNNPDNIEFYVTKPANGDKANFGNGTQISFITYELYTCQYLFWNIYVYITSRMAGPGIIHLVPLFSSSG